MEEVKHKRTVRRQVCRKLAPKECNIDENGRLVIPKAFRDWLGLNEFTNLRVMLIGEAIRIEKILPAKAWSEA